ncbi:hypothetical protein A2422_00965 [Candidatus Woesebacteria bacterium RIFOXYC1_FULL_31_51]|uniref:Tetratricopeptide TPR_2 repeat protein n=1 Tax=Candidatus Woesebacteria bacterium GW2011_GWC2_31_9 TaxID=1618586 RepID=A0A0F9YYE1_9BACT|nr:MAG: hypothetical protein UR17_C0001G0642 [Candidatus Woesebacteria bacterium GW2011_GWF1_31_35]KKP22744.1 MAG: Tetratricopeptide TPR_2 repeat protein [Candidatus Woesebacteria bacterium GW2011_GWC1_30_29]KKP25873.1 MAG: Tetratricopeptide TPR_2 repeat protein [Candidatus Woesebacteria bacterium GW2011_GWD1_31_12]KKP27992.1 MAG: Tetratricopeptide TPR_2 repeat protein [Candidatus Woesebacteria bacterium GW2011_GWB1_31_29]KKP31466.1 MAG: Tetratricopeptide TPR_2 repeat protein [Candidatus Woeseb
MEENLTRKAINLALRCQWKEAIKINKLIIKEDGSDTEALNRLARAYLETGEITKAKGVSKKVLKIEPSNKIAEKSIEKYKRFKTNVDSGSEQNIDASVFLEEVGKTKLTNLINLGSPKNISKLYSGDEVKLLTHSHRATITTLDDTYVGRLPDDISARIRLLVKGGNSYKVFIKSVCSSNIKVFIKEVKKGKEFENCMSFPLEKSESIDESSSQSDFEIN